MGTMQITCSSPLEIAILAVVVIYLRGGQGAFQTAWSTVKNAGKAIISPVLLTVALLLVILLGLPSIQLGVLVFIKDLSRQVTGNFNPPSDRPLAAAPLIDTV